MPAINFNDAGFGIFLSKSLPGLSLDLSNSTLTEVISAYQTYRRKRNRNYTLSSEIYNIQLLEQHYGVKLLPSHITEEFWNYFYVYMVNRGCTPSTIKTYCTNIRTALKWASHHRVSLSDTYELFDIPNYRKTMICLAPFEVANIYYFDINTLPIRPQAKRTLEQVRDMFVLSCMLGQRHSDMARITPDCFSDNGNVFTIIQQKTGNKAVVDISAISMDKTITMEILNKYNYTSPYQADIYNYNRNIHRLLQYIGGTFNIEVKSENKILGKISTLSVPKYNAIASHTGRRTFVNYAMSQEISIRKIMKATGHSDLRSFQQYWCEEVR